MAKHWTLEVRVGSFILAGLTLLVVFVFVIGDLSTYFQPGYRLYVEFSSANGITEGSPVQYAGVEVGKVQRVKLVYQLDAPSPHVELTIRLPSSVTVREDDVADISTFGLLGEKYLAINPGKGEGNILSPGGRMYGKPPVTTELLIEQSDEVLKELKEALQGINSLVGDSEARIHLEETLREARDATRHWRALGERLNIAMIHAEAGQGSLGKFLFDDDLYNRVSLMVDDLRAHPWKLLARPKRHKKKVDE